MPPTALIQSIHDVRRRARLLSLVYGVGIVIAAAVALLVATVAVDYLLNLRSIPRVVVMMAAVAGMGYLVFRYVARPAVASLSLNDVAGRLERAFPQFDDRLRSTIDFLEGRNPGSGILQQRVIEQAASLATEVRFSDALVRKPAIISASSAITACLLVLILAFGLIDHRVLSIISSRLLTPFSAQPWPKRVQIALTSSVPTRVPVGQRIDVQMKLDRGDRASLKPILFYQAENGPVQQMFMSRGENGQFQSSLDARLDPSLANGKLNIWIEAGDDTRTLDPITIVPRLGIQQAMAAITPPAYVKGRAPGTQDISTSPVVTAEGSQLQITYRFNKALGGSDPFLETVGTKTEPLTAQWSRPEPSVAVATLDAMKSTRFRLRAIDSDGFSNSALEEYELIVKPDTNLSVQLENPRRSDERTPDAFVPLQAVIEDDCGAEWVKLVVNRLQPSPMTWEIPLVTDGNAEKDVAWQPIESTPDRVRFRMNDKWELAKPKLTPGDVIEYAVVARDNFNLNGRRHDPVSSSKLRITIISQDDLAGRVTDEMRVVKSQAGLVRLSQQRGKLETQQFGRDTQTKPNLDAADHSAAQRLAQQQASTAASAKQLATRVQLSLDRLNENRATAQEIKDIAADVKNTLETTSEGAMKEAAQQLNAAATQTPLTPAGPQPAGAQPQGQSERSQQDQAAADQAQRPDAQSEKMQSEKTASEKASSAQPASQRPEAQSESRKPQEQAAGERQSERSASQKAQGEQSQAQNGESQQGQSQSSQGQQSKSEQSAAQQAQGQQSQSQQGQQQQDQQAQSQQPQTEQQQQRGEAIASAQVNQQKALDQLDRAMAKMENIGSLQTSVNELNAILAEQRALRKENEDFSKNNLGKKPEQLAAAEKTKLDEIAAKQAKLGDRTQQTMEKMQQQSGQMQKSDPAASEAMKAAAQQAQQSKVTQTQQRASQQTSQNQQASAQQSQQQVELGLEQAIGELKEAQKRELARLQQHLAELQEQLATLIRRQSGHNLDNLLLQGPEQLRKIDPKVVATLTGDSQRSPDSMKAPELRLLSTGQELTDRNTRDLARTADGEPQAAAIGAQLVKAAGKMERAIVGLRDGKVAEAYDPEQVEALAALIDAKKQLDDQKTAADDKAQQQQKEAIRQRFLNVQKEQQRINADTLRVDQARDAAGEISRVEWPTIRRLPTEQAAAGDTLGKIDEDLTTLGSIVYIWANRDIKSAMDAVKGDLTASKTGVPTRAEQDRIVEQLGAMIDNLKEPAGGADEKFENANNGGGSNNEGGQKGGQQQPRPPQMPTEIELRLLKSLQTAVNTSTTKINAATEKVPDALASVGGRQGELRTLLDSLLKKASRDKIQLDPEPENKDQLPEETAAAVNPEEADLEAALLGNKPDKPQAQIDKDFKLVGTRMARSKQRLALNSDPGAVTQEIQKRILTDFDDLIATARRAAQQQQQQQRQQQQQAGKQQQAQQQQANNQRQANNPGQNQQDQNENPDQRGQGAINDNHAAAGSKPHDLAALTEKAQEWGGVSDRVRKAVIESRGESVVEQYRKIIEDYYGAISAQGTKSE